MSYGDSVRADGKRVMYDKRPAPSLLVVYLCGECGGKAVLDAYKGPPTCVEDRAFMRPLRLAESGSDNDTGTGTRTDT